MYKELSTTYKGCEIYFSEFNEVWVARVIDGGAQIGENTSLHKLKESVDRWVKKNNKEIPCIAISSDYNTTCMQLENVIITSISERSDYCWIRKQNGSREKLEVAFDGSTWRRKVFVIANDVNTKTLLEINNLREEIQKLNQEIESKNKMIVVKCFELTPYLGSFHKKETNQTKE